MRDDGKPLSVQYLNDIEHGRRGAPPDYVIGQLAKLLRVEIDVLCGDRRALLSRGAAASRHPKAIGFRQTRGRRLPRASPGTAFVDKILKKLFSYNVTRSSSPDHALEARSTAPSLAAMSNDVVTYLTHHSGPLSSRSFTVGNRHE